MIKVLIADDHDIVREGIRRVLDDMDDVTVCGEAREGREVLTMVARTQPDVLVLDVNMPESAGPGIIKEIQDENGRPRVVVFTMYNEDSHAVSFLRAGASSFINKRRASDELIRAIRWAAEGRRYITPELADYLFQNQIDVQKSPKELLSSRELEVIRGLADGLRATEIAINLGVSASTINTYVQRIKTKLGVRTAVEIVQFSMENSLLG